MALNPEIWGPWYWGFLHTIAIAYPNFPNAETKKKYYELIQSLPLFIPVESISTSFGKLLQLYPVSPYLDNKQSFIKWVHFIHNKINEKLEKPTISLNDFYVNYYNYYKPKRTRIDELYKLQGKIIYIVILSIILYGIYVLYNK
jgi:hypothetical protein